MIKPELYKKTVDILFDAYFNDTLQRGNCCACAVGNLVAANMGIKFKPGMVVRSAWEKDAFPEWQWVIWGYIGGDLETGAAQVQATGYSVYELKKIEMAFESVVSEENALPPEDNMFNGLVAVLEVLKQIHQVSEADEINNERFESHYKTRSKVLG